MTDPSDDLDLGSVAGAISLPVPGGGSADERTSRETAETDPGGTGRQQPGETSSDARRHSGSRGGHAVLFIGTLAGWLTLLIVAGIIVVQALTADMYLSQQARDAAVFRAMAVATGALWLLAVTSVGLAAARVGYRFRDGLFVLVPIYSWIFVSKILWRWTALPDRYWESPLEAARAREIDPHSVGATAEQIQAVPARQKRPGAVLLSGILGFVILAGALGYTVIQRGGETRGTGEWRTSRVDGMAISLPRSFEVFTDPGDFARALEEAGPSQATDLAETIKQFPGFFVLSAIEVPSRMDPPPALVVMRFPSDGSLEEFARLYSTGVAEAGVFTIDREAHVAVGAGFRYPAVRLDYGGSLPGSPALRGVSYLVDRGAVVWVFDFTMIREENERLSPISEEAIFSLTLP